MNCYFHIDRCSDQLSVVHKDIDFSYWLVNVCCFIPYFRTLVTYGYSIVVNILDVDDLIR